MLTDEETTRLLTLIDRMGVNMIELADRLVKVEEKIARMDSPFYIPPK